MKKFAVLAVLAFGLLIPSAASAHVDYWNVTISGTPWSSTTVNTNNITLYHKACWQLYVLGPGQTVYLHNGGIKSDGSPASPGAWGLAYAQDFTHWHPFQSSQVTGPETRQFMYEYINNPGILATRRVNTTGGTSVQAVKFVNQSGPYSVVIRANC